MDAAYAQGYLDLWRKHWWWQVRHQIVLGLAGGLLRDRGPSPPTILDIGCLGGAAFDDLEALGTVYGLEPDPHLVDCQPRWRHRVRQATFGRDFQDPRSYDLVLMLDVLEHIQDDAGALERLHGALKPGGHAIVTVPALPSLWSRHDEVNHHFRRYRRGPLRRLLHGAGFEVIELRYLFLWTLGLMYLRKLVANGQGTQYRVGIPSRPVNAVFRGLCAIERWCFRSMRVGPPLGSSLLAVVQRPLESTLQRARSA
jgi:SAM-dependent methyltransferase